MNRRTSPELNETAWPFISRRQATRSGPQARALNLFVTDVDALYRELKARGAKALSEPEDYPWGMRNFSIHALDGNRLCFGMPSRHGAESSHR